MADLSRIAPRLSTALHDNNQDAIDLLKRIISERSSIGRVAKFSYDVLEIFYAHPIYRAR